MLFVLIACGACSGFHSVIASGTTSKQLRRETDAKLIGYGAMLLEAMVAVVSLCCVMKLSVGHQLIGKGPNYLYAVGVGDFLSVLGIPVAFGVAFGLMAFTTFVYDTLDVCTRLGRYILQELTGRHDRLGPLGVDGRHGGGAAVLFAAAADARRRRESDPGLEGFLEPVRGEQPTAGGLDADGRDGLAVADAARLVGVAGHRRSGRR